MCNKMRPLTGPCCRSRGCCTMRALYHQFAAYKAAPCTTAHPQQLLLPTVCPASSAWQLHQCQRSKEPQGSRSTRQTECRGRWRHDSSLQDAGRQGWHESCQELPAGTCLLTWHGATAITVPKAGRACREQAITPCLLLLAFSGIMSSAQFGSLT